MYGGEAFETISNRVYDRIKHSGFGYVAAKDFNLIVLGTIYALGEYSDPAFDAVTNETLTHLARPLQLALGVGPAGRITR